MANRGEFTLVDCTGSYKRFTKTIATCLVDDVIELDTDLYSTTTPVSIMSLRVAASGGSATRVDPIIYSAETPSAGAVTLQTDWVVDGDAGLVFVGNDGEVFVFPSLDGKLYVRPNPDATATEVVVDIMIGLL